LFFFQITEGTSAVVTGFVRTPEKCTLTDMPPVPESDFPMLETKDFYKELRLRGYHYNGAFRAVEQARGDGVVGKIKWDLNWVAFMDCMLQIQIIGQDSRSLLLPTGIQKMTINPKQHLEIAGVLTPEDPVFLFDVEYNANMNIIRAGGIEIKGLQASPVGRRKPPGFPVLESYKFIPHLPTPPLKRSDAVRVFVQLALENIPILKVKVVEVDTVSAEPILISFQEALGDLPLVTSDLMFLTPQTLELPGIHVEDGKLSTQTNCIFVIGSECLANPEFMGKVASSLSESGFVVSREKPGLTIEEIEVPSGFQLLIVASTETDTLVLLQHQKRKFFGSPSIVKVCSNDDEFTWLDELRTGMKNGPVILVAQKDSLNGIIGLVNCIRKEPDGHLASCVFVDDDKAPEFELEDEFYKNHLKLGLAINVYRDVRT
jgi:fatty acid synthase, animal type